MRPPSLLMVLVAAPVSAQQSVTAFVDVAVVPMDRERILTNQTVVVRGNRITAVGRVGQVRVPPRATRVDGRGKYLMPGLADMHAHVPGMGGMIKYQLIGHPSMHRPADSAATADAERALALYALNGVTTIRLMSGWAEQLKWRERAATGEWLSPRLYVASPPFRNFEEPAEGVARVEAAKAAGYDLIKLYGIDDEVLDSTVAAARRLGLPVAGHTPSFYNSPTSLTKALEVGYRSIEHLVGYDLALFGESRGEINGWPVHPELDTVKLRAIAEASARAGVWNCVTEIIFQLYRWSPDTMATWPEMRYVSEATLADWRQSSMWSPNETPLSADAALAARATVIRALRDAGAGLLLGTDMGVQFLVPGFAVHRELQALVSAGLSPYEALATGTRNVAAYFGTLETTGTVAVGKQADLMLLSGNPLRDIRQTVRPAGVMVAGRWVPREEIDRRLARMEGMLR